MYRNRSLRLMFFGIGLAAVIALTGMNVYSLYELRESSIEAAKDNKKNQIEEFTRQVGFRFMQPFRGVRKLDVEYLQEYYQQHDDFPQNLKNVLVEASRDSIFSSIYFSPDEKDHCLDPSQPIYEFEHRSREFLEIPEVSELVCDGLGLARSRMKVLLDDYRWNNKITFDSHRSMTLSMINLEQRQVVGHLTFLINPDYLVGDYLAVKLKEKFGPSDQTGIVVWLRDYMQETILAESEAGYEYRRDLQIDIRQRFPDMLDNWILHAKIIDSPTIAASNASLTRNLIVLGLAVISLFGALVFMFITAKKERELAQHQAGFLANVTHELKTPLATMQAAGENLADGRVNDSERIKTYGDHIYNETIRLRKMIDKLLDIARIDSGQTTVQRAPHRLDDLVRYYYESHKSYIESKGFEFNLEIEDDLPKVRVDSDHFETILNNLIDNAVKYSRSEKRIDLQLYKQDNKVHLAVKDRGIGIPKYARHQIFKKFYRLEDSLTARTKGHGLGLSIVENLVMTNHGEIRIEPNFPQGSIFIVSFPFISEEVTAELSEPKKTETIYNRVDIELQ